jgi:hypothetical protein
MRIDSAARAFEQEHFSGVLGVALILRGTLNPSRDVFSGHSWDSTRQESAIHRNTRQREAHSIHAIACW